MTIYPWCCWCAINHVAQRLDAEHKCPTHGLVLDRLLGSVRMDVRFLKEDDDGRR